MTRRAPREKTASSWQKFFKIAGGRTDLKPSHYMIAPNGILSGSSHAL
jgi:hypothetical protein